MGAPAGPDFRERRPPSAGELAVALALALAVAAAIGAGPRNGDVVAYVAQARAGDWLGRPTHALYVLGIAPIARVADPFPLLDLLSAAAVGAAALAGPRPVAAAVALAPIAASGEVDPLWIALLAWSARHPGLAGAAVGVSPAALLALPAARDPRAAAWALGAALALVAVTGGAWITADRGLLDTPPFLPGRTLAAWALHWPWALAPLARWTPELGRALLLAAPLALLPPDVPGWAVPALAIARATRPGAGWVALQAAVAIGLVHADAARVRAETATLAGVAAALRPGDGIEAPFSWGARASFAATGDPYGWPWHPPGGWLRDQEARWEAASPTRVWHLPPDPAGVVAVSGATP